MIYRLFPAEIIYITFFLLLALLSYTPNLSSYPFKNEESLRVAVAFEMWYSGNYWQPSFLGELYYNKPPLFNWLIISYSYLFGWSELTARAVSITFLLLTAFTVCAFSYSLFRNINTALFSSLIFLTFGNVLFFYGFLAEIDITLSFFVFFGIYCIYLLWKSGSVIWSILAGAVFGFSALLKGLPSYAFLLLSLIAFSLYHKNLSFLFNKRTFLIYFLSLFIPLLWLLQTADPIFYLQNLWRESFSRVSGDFSRIRHMILYPIINFKDLLPWSFLFLISLYRLRKDVKLPLEIRLLSMIFIVNYLPYWVSNSAGRYILPLYPLLAIIFSFYIYKAMQKDSIKKLILGSLFIVILLRFFYGAVFFAYTEDAQGSRKKIAKDMASLINLKESIACECPEEKSVCLYLALWKGEPLYRLSKIQEERTYVISCGKTFGNVLKEYSLKGKSIRLEKYSTLNP